MFDKHVMHLPASAMAAWQREYAIQDTFLEGWVFVTDSSRCTCKLFRVQHNRDNPTHELAQINETKYVLCPLRPMHLGEDLTFDYFGKDDIVSSGSRLIPRQQHRVLGVTEQQHGIAVDVNRFRHTDRAATKRIARVQGQQASG